MNSSSLSAARTPFIRLLVPLLAGILYQEFLCLPIWGNLIPALCGLVLWSSFIKRDSIEEQYHKRSIFGVGLFLIVFSIGAILHGTQNRISQQPSGFYPIAIAHVNDKAVEKTNSYYCPVTITALSDTNGSIVKYKEKIALYFEKGIQARRLEYGDIIGFEFRPKAIPPNTNRFRLVHEAQRYIEKSIFDRETMEIYRRKTKIESSKGYFGSTKTSFRPTSIL